MNKKAIKLVFVAPVFLGALVIVCVFAFQGVQRALIEDNEVLAHTVAQSLLPALLVNDSHQVDAVVKALEANPNVLSAELISAQGAPIASYSRSGESFDPLTASFELATAEDDPYKIHVIAPLTFDSLIVANLHIAINLWPIYMRIMTWLGFILIVPSVMYVLVKHFQIKLRFEVLSSDDGSAGGGPGFDVRQAVSAAMSDSNVSVEYQPIQRMSDSGSFGMEAVVCWRHPSGQTLHISPDDFVTLADKSQIALPFDEWLLVTACSQAAVWQHQFGPLILAINISGSQYNDPFFAQKVREVCVQTQYPYQLLELEVREALVLHHQQRALENFKAFEAQGLSLTIDGFGLTSASMDVLEILPIHKVKLDRKLVKQMNTDATIAQLVQATVDRAISQDVQVMVDGLESVQQREALLRMGCVFGQGREFHPPMSARGFEAFLKDRSFETSGARSLELLQSRQRGNFSTV